MERTMPQINDLIGWNWGKIILLHASYDTVCHMMWNFDIWGLKTTQACSTKYFIICLCVKTIHAKQVKVHFAYFVQCVWHGIITKHLTQCKVECDVFTAAAIIAPWPPYYCENHLKIVLLWRKEQVKRLFSLSIWSSNLEFTICSDWFCFKSVDEMLKFWTIIFHATWRNARWGNFF